MSAKTDTDGSLLHSGPLPEGEGAAVLDATDLPHEPAPHRASAWRRALPLVMLTLVVMIWSSNNIATKLALLEVAPGALALVRFTTVALIFHLPVFLLVRRMGRPLARRDWVRLGVAAVFGYGASTLFFTVGITMTTATYAALMLMTGPLWTAILERIFVGTPIRVPQAAGMGIAFLSAAYLGTDGSIEGADLTMLIGGALMMGAQTTWGAYTIVTKPLLSRRPPLVILTAANLIAMPFVWPVTGLIGGWSDVVNAFSWSMETWLALIYLIVVAGIVSQVLYVYGLRDVAPSQAMAFSYLMPVFTAVFASIFLDEQVTLATFVCGALIVFGLWLMNATRRRPLSSGRPATIVTSQASLPVVGEEEALTRG
jgi:drug/metabolite transporter (DMT)-like permease